MKTAGREAGKFCIIVDSVGQGFVLVTGPKAITHVKRRKCNIEHLEPTPEVIKIAKNASDDDVIAAYKKHGVLEKLSQKLPSEKEMEAAKDAEMKRISEKKREESQAVAKAEEIAVEQAVEKEVVKAEAEVEKKAVKKKASKKAEKAAEPAGPAHEHAPAEEKKHEEPAAAVKPARKKAAPKKKAKAEG
jgi:large subunit ribosomal protein L14e